MKRLSRREAEIASFVRSGMNDCEIAKALGIAKQTVRNHIHRAIKKAGVRNRIQLSNWILDHRRISLQRTPTDVR